MPKIKHTCIFWSLWPTLWVLTYLTWQLVLFNLLAKRHRYCRHKKSHSTKNIVMPACPVAQPRGTSCGTGQKEKLIFTRRSRTLKGNSDLIVFEHLLTSKSALGLGITVLSSVPRALLPDKRDTFRKKCYNISHIRLDIQYRNPGKPHVSQEKKSPD